MSVGESSLDWALKRDRWLIVFGLTVAIVVSWSYLLTGAGMSMSMTMDTPVTWSSTYFLMVLVMWWVMMAAMMLPSAAPTILLFAALNRKMNERGHAAVPAGVFASAYVTVWGGFSVLATLLQMKLDQAALLDPVMTRASVALGGVLLLAAGVYQLTPLKYACLRRCRSPIHFLSHRWKKGPRGAFLMGLEHGAFCLGCCWVMMGVLFYAGVMNLAWIAGIALYVLLEKLAPAGQWLSRMAGIALIVWGGAVLTRSLSAGLL